MGGGSPVVGPLAGIPGATYQLWASVLIVLGIGVNIAFIPLHTWLPDAYPRANFVASVFLSVYTTKAAVYLLARAQPGTEFIAFMGAIMAVYGVIFAVFQNDMRRLLSYHIVSQVGYMVAGIGILGWLGAADAVGQLGLNGGMAHLFNHILYKALLFMAIGVIIWKTGENALSRVGGLQKKMPVTAIAFWIAAFSIAGVPLFNGFVSKGMVLACGGTHQHMAVGASGDRILRDLRLVPQARVFRVPAAGDNRGLRPAAPHAGSHAGDCRPLYHHRCLPGPPVRPPALSRPATWRMTRHMS